MQLSLPTEIRGYSDAVAFLKQLRNIELNLFLAGRPERAHFRGEEDVSYHLQPKLCRYGRTFSELTSLEPLLMADFKHMLISAGLYNHIQVGFLNAPFHDEWLLYQQAQHLGLATRFLDWTLSFEVAIYFACESLKSKDGKLYVYFPDDGIFQADRPADSYGSVSPTQITDPIFLNPSDFADANSMNKFAQRFKQRQHGRFLVTPLDMAMTDMIHFIESNSLFHAAIIPQKAKADIMDGLRHKGFTRERLFLDDDPFAVQFKQTISPMIADLHKKFSLV